MMTPDRRMERSSEIQRRYFEHADARRFFWTTSGAGFAEVEEDLLVSALRHIVPPCLEVGCGEGNNLVRLRRNGRCIGVDLFPAKLVFAAQHVPDASFAAADGAALPFRDACFQTVFIRDLLHHVPTPERALAEAVRVLRPGGNLCVLEPNGRNPLVRLQSRLVPAERGARSSGTTRLHDLLDGLPLTAIQMRMLQPLPLRRLILHYQFGFPALGRLRPMRWILATAEHVVGRLLPPTHWTYVAATGQRI